MNAVTKLDEPGLPALSESAAILQIIERAATNPNVDIDKMERLLMMQERIHDRNALAAYNTALSELQPRLPVISERGVISTDKGKTIQSRYALWEDINDAIKPLLAEHGFALSFRTGFLSDGKLTVTGVLSHREGHREETTIALPHDSSGSKNAVQAVGSSTSYGKRYTACALLNITTGGQDDDGRAGGTPATVTTDQAHENQELMESVGADRGRFLNYFGADSIATIPAARFTDAIEMLSAKRRR